MVVIEAENLNLSSSWAIQNSTPGFTGSGYILWLGPQYTSVPGNGLITTKIFINSPGIYRFQFRSGVGRGTSSSEHNDTWIRFPDASDFFAEKEGIKLYPRGSGKTPTVKGAGSGGWFKAFASNVNWRWTTQTNDGDGYPIFVQFDSPGEYTMELSARSSYHLIDRIILHRNASNPLSLTQLETTCDTSPPQTINVTGISVLPINLSLQTGSSQQVSATISPANATNKTVLWSSANPTIATVSSNGLVSAVSEGTTIITARTQDGNFTGTSTITVNPNTSTIAVTGISISPNTLSVTVGSSQQIIATVSPNNASNKSITWSSSNPSVAGVNSGGMVTGLTVGSSIITARTLDGNFTSSSAITVNPNTSSISIGSFTLVNAGTATDIATLVNGTNLSLSQIQNLSLNFRINTNPSLVGSVFISLTGPINASRTENGAPYTLFGDSNGNYNGRTLPLGTYNLSAIPYSGSNRSGTAGPSTTITFSIVESAPIRVSGISVSPAAVSIIIGELKQISATITPSNSSNKNVIWSSSNTAVATVNSSGLVLGLALGDADISAKSEDGDFISISKINVLGDNSSQNLVGHWKMDEGIGSSLIDHSGNDNNANLQNPANVFWSEGIIGDALNLNGWSGRFGIAPHSTSLESVSNSLTIAAWVKPNILHRGHILYKSSGNGFELWLDSNGLLEFRLNRSNNGTTYRLKSTYNYSESLGNWIHIAATFDGTSSRIYVNGVQNVSANYAPFNIGTSSGDLVIGAFGTIQRFNGALDDLRLYNRALTDIEIGNLAVVNNQLRIDTQIDKQNLEKPLITNELSRSQPISMEVVEITSLYPNPVDHTIYISYAGQEGDLLQIGIFDAKGVNYLEREYVVLESSVTVPIKELNLQPGIHLLVIKTQLSYQVLKFIKK
ncbi:Ig-like domain-containing protein [Cognataquiflexum rubidum]|uniref:Ig-like domain-containing protein n=1 Tax=Cognataquiflexum rubidum TaxID=2922273 RepID=UPI001F14244D|nr:Ig-like domain-containing protein [Cognataquiflexum rubidum]MCH6236797.1 Ig-like domain-containing protein [Cognataquiflexum rubidum]